MSQALSRKWRPARFEQVIGQEHVTRTLQNSVTADRVSHAYLFCGPRGTGKTTMARLLAKAVNCLSDDPAARPDDTCANCIAVNEARFLDLIEIDAASNTGVDDIRSLRDKINFAPSQGRYKVYIIDEVHMLSTAAFNALLKTLEEPPAHAIFVLATTEEHKVPLTIKSRCQQYNFRLLTIGEISGRLEFLAENESLTVEPAALDLIARQAGGSLRDGESLLDQLFVAPGDTITLDRAQLVLGTAPDAAVAELTQAWLDADPAHGLDTIHEALVSGADARQFARQMVAYLRDLLLLQAAGQRIALDGPAERHGTMMQQAQRAPRRTLIDAVRRFHEASVQPAANWQPQLPLELAFLELVVDAAPKTAAVPIPTAPPQATPDPVQQQAAPAPTPESRATARPAAMKVDKPSAAKAATPPPPPTDDPSATPPARAKRSDPAADAAAGAPPAAAETVLDLEQVKTVWPSIIVQLGQQNKNLPPLMAMAKPLALEGMSVVVGFDFPIFRHKFDTTEGAAAALTAALRAHTNSAATIRSVVTSEYAVPIQKDEFQDLARELGGIVREE